MVYNIIVSGTGTKVGSFFMKGMDYKALNVGGGSALFLAVIDNAIRSVAIGSNYFVFQGIGYTVEKGSH